MRRARDRVASTAAVVLLAVLVGAGARRGPAAALTVAGIVAVTYDGRIVLADEAGRRLATLTRSAPGRFDRRLAGVDAHGPALVLVPSRDGRGLAGVVQARREPLWLGGDGAARRLRPPTGRPRARCPLVVDGRHLVFTLPAGGVATALASGRGVRLLGRGFEAEWSPDGRRIVYARMGPTPAADAVWVMNRDGSGAHRILRGASSPSWRPGPVPQAVGRSTSSRQRP